jgi:thiamine-phosphate diphosphorylase
MAEQELLALCRKLKLLTDAFGVPLVLNDRADLAAQAGVGVHLGPEDGSVAQARQLLGPAAIVGATARTAPQALAAEAAGADYLGCGAVFGSATKANAPPMPLRLLRDICGAAAIPAVAIGGINQENIGTLRGCGMAGFAVVSGIFGATHITSATQALRSLAQQLLRPPLLFDLFSTLVSIGANDQNPQANPLYFTKEEWALHNQSEALWRRSTGLVTEPWAIVREMAESVGKHPTKAQLEASVRYRLDLFRRTLTQVQPEILETLKILRARGHRLCLVSNADFIDIAAWDISPLARCFDEVLFSCKAGHAKPEPELYLHAAKLLGAAPENCVFLGDGGSNEHAGAKALGMQTIRLRHFVQRDTVPGVDVVLDRFSDLLRHIF